MAAPESPPAARGLDLLLRGDKLFTVIGCVASNESPGDSIDPKPMNAPLYPADREVQPDLYDPINRIKTVQRTRRIVAAWLTGVMWLIDAMLSRKLTQP